MIRLLESRSQPPVQLQPSPVEHSAAHTAFQQLLQFAPLLDDADQKCKLENKVFLRLSLVDTPVYTLRLLRNQLYIIVLSNSLFFYPRQARKSHFFLLVKC